MTISKGGSLWNGSQSHTRFEPAIDPANPGDWVLISDDGNVRRWELDMGDHVIGKTEYLNISRLFDRNAHEYNESQGKRWSDTAVGQIGSKIGSVPMNIYFQSGLAEANRQRDKSFIKRWWEDPDNRKFRTREGRI